MRAKLVAGVVMALAFLIPAAPAVAQPGAPGLNADCQTVERNVYRDIRKLITIDPDTATDTQLRILANQLLSVATGDLLPFLPDRIQERLDGTEEDLRAFVKSGVRSAWIQDLRILMFRTTGAGSHVQEAAAKALDSTSIDDWLAYLNDGLYVARALDCPTPPTATASVTPGVTKTAAPTTTSSTSSPAAGGAGGEGGGLPLTGTNTGIVAGVGGVLLLLGGVGYLLGRRRRSRFVA